MSKQIFQLLILVLSWFFAFSTFSSEENKCGSEYLVTSKEAREEHKSQSICTVNVRINTPVKGLYESIPKGSITEVENYRGYTYGPESELYVLEPSQEKVTVNYEAWKEFYQNKLLPPLQHEAKMVHEKGEENLEKERLQFKHDRNNPTYIQYSRSLEAYQLLQHLKLDRTKDANKIFSVLKEEATTRTYIRDLIPNKDQLLDHKRIFVPDINAKQERLVARFVRDIDTDSGTIIFSGSYFDENAIVPATKKRLGPSFLNVPETVPLIEGRGIPTQVFFTLQQMKNADVKFGTLRKARSHIRNTKTSHEILRQPYVAELIKKDPKNLVLNKLIQKYFLVTHTGLYFQTSLIQSGHQINVVHVLNAKLIDDELSFDVSMELAPFNSLQNSTSK